MNTLTEQLTLHPHVRDLSIENACPPQKSLPSPFSLTRNRVYLGTHLKEELTDLFRKLPVNVFPHWQSRQRMVDTLLIVNINLICQIFGEELNGGVHFFLS